jgi:cellulose synthase/poly-beta-1,6-N-acetylglucosamine synthase-like glycosyltransferase
MTALAAVLLPVALVWLLPALAEVVNQCRALTRRADGRTLADDASEPQRLLVLVPAHDEALLIERCVRSLVAMETSRANVDIVVIADNCTDDTAAIAQRAGARVLERHNLTDRGKPQAIAWAMAQHAMDRYDGVVILDADSLVEPGFAGALAASGRLRDRAAQGYLGLSNETDSWLSRLAGLLARVRYEGQYPLKRRAGLNCPLTGNGMCLGTGLLARAGWPERSLTENWEVYARYTVRGERIDYVQQAVVHAQEARSMGQSTVQRTRWQAGRLGVLGQYAGAILRSAHIGWAQKLDIMAELSSPGPVVHATVAVLAGTALALADAPLARIVGLCFLLSVVPMAVWTVRAWAQSPDPAGVAVALVRLPVYAAWRLVVAAMAVGRARGLAWRRSPRHVEGE